MVRNRRVVAYLRVSTDSQAEYGYGLDGQREKIEYYTRALDITVDEWVVDDGYSGATLDRPGIRRIVDEINADNVAKVIVYKLDRLSRDLKNLLVLYDETFEPNKAALVSVSESFDTSTASGRMFFEILGSFAGYERRVITERLRNGKTSKAKAGDRAVGDIPYGYRSIDGTTVIEPKTSAVVTRIFDLAGEPKIVNGRNRWSVSLQAIADILNAENIPTPKGGKRWYGSTIKTILDNPIYHGRIEQVVGGVVMVSENSSLALL